MKEGFLVACHHCYASQWKGMIELLFEVQWLIDRLSISKMITNHLAAVKLVWETHEKNMQIFLVCSLHFPLAKNVNLANGCLFISGESTINRISWVQFMQYNKGDICAYVWHRFLHLNTPAVVAAASQSHGPSSLCPLPTGGVIAYISSSSSSSSPESCLSDSSNGSYQSSSPPRGSSPSADPVLPAAPAGQNLPGTAKSGRSSTATKCGITSKTLATV